MACRCSRHSHPRASPYLEVGEEEDGLTELLGILTHGPSQWWYTLNGDMPTKVSLCQILGFFLETDHYTFLVHKNLAAYWLNKTSRKMELTILHREWGTYLSNKRYKLGEALCARER